MSDLDALTGCLQPKQLLVIGARPTMGKSTLALDVVGHATIVHGKTAAFFSLEMGRDEINQRLFSARPTSRCTTSAPAPSTPEDLTRLADHTPAIQTRRRFLRP
ncbi:DnaB-like helicase C-terminal domain-containing protein [Streptomyces sp. NBC_01185]|uniref:DnaB-like helicase C-terminal domain-containing protein n=1 Tax=Streptomyces sp. NBC_01185 TaxID=2903764 RepID=UPI0038648E54